METTGNAFPKLRLRAFAPVQERETLESKFWKNFGVTLEEKYPTSPNCVSFCSALPSHYLVTGSTRVSMYDRLTDKIQRSFSRFSDDAYSGKFRKDGKLIVAGDKMGTVKIFDVQSKAMLRQMKRHSGAVRSTCWNSDGLYFLSASDDKTVKKWDLGTGEVVWDSAAAGRQQQQQFAAQHTDYVRAVDANPTSPHLFCSGSYDHSVRMWDSRQPAAVLTLDHGCPVEACLLAPSGALLLSAGGQEVRVWDLIGGKAMHTFSNHQKNVTSLALDGSGSRVLSAGLDGHVKVYSLQTMMVVHGMKFGAPLSCVGVSPDNRKLVVGFVDGNLLVRTRHADGGPSGASLGLDTLTGGLLPAGADGVQPAANRFYKGAGAAAERAEDGMVEAERNTRLRPYEALLKKFSYQKALDAALKTRNPLVIVTVLEELSRRNGLVTALSGRDEASLEPLLSFAAKFISNPRFCHLIIKVSHTILDLYASVLGHSDAIDELFNKLQKHVRCEVAFQHSIMAVLGMLDAVVNASAAR